METVFTMILFAPFMLGAWAAPSVSRSLSELVAIAGVVWVPALAVGVFLHLYLWHELQLLSWWGLLVVLSLPVLFAFSVGVVGQFLILAFTRRGTSQEQAIRLVSLLAMVGVPVWLLF